jgi:hypothetical protein
MVLHFTVTKLKKMLLTGDAKNIARMVAKQKSISLALPLANRNYGSLQITIPIQLLVDKLKNFE